MTSNRRAVEASAAVERPAGGSSCESGPDPGRLRADRSRATEAVELRIVVERTIEDRTVAGRVRERGSGRRASSTGPWSHQDRPTRFRRFPDGRRYRGMRPRSSGRRPALPGHREFDKREIVVRTWQLGTGSSGGCSPPRRVACQSMLPFPANEPGRFGRRLPIRIRRNQTVFDRAGAIESADLDEIAIIRGHGLGNRRPVPRRTVERGYS